MYFDFVHEAVLKQPDPDPASAHGRHFRPQSFRAIVADHDDLIARVPGPC